MQQARQAAVRRRWAGIAALCVASYAWAGSAGAQTTQTTTTTYQRNADGALTAVTVQVGTQPPTVTYLSWDNFTPNADAPTTGTVSAADGNLLAIGAAPAVAAQFAYDARDRLTACSPTDGAPASTYAYHPTGLMASSTLASGDALQFYYDTGPLPLMINTSQPSTGMAASFLESVRYLSDGTEQALLQPRRDVSAVYDDSEQSLAPYAYDPYGQSLASSATPLDTYDLTDNPFQYAGEYQDPTCGAYYLRTRWYLPEWETFLSRDAGDPLHRYGYTAGNPVGRVDPSGLRSVEGGARALLASLEADRDTALGAASRVFLGGVIGIAQIFADPSGYWHQMRHDAHGLDIFLGAGIALEIGTSGFGSLPELPGDYLANFAAHHAIDASLGVGQSLATGWRGRRMDWESVGQGLEYTAGAMVDGRELLGFGYKPFSLDAGDVATQAARHFGDDNHEFDVLVYRVRGPLIKRPLTVAPFTSPLMELAHLGFYHEMLVGVLLQWDSDANRLAPASYSVSIEPWRPDANGPLLHERVIERRSGVGIDPRNGAKFVGRYTAGADKFLGAVNWHDGYDDFRTELDRKRFNAARGAYPKNPYRVFGNNCQNFAARMRSNLGFP